MITKEDVLAASDVKSIRCRELPEKFHHEKNIQVNYLTCFEQSKRCLIDIRIGINTSRPIKYGKSILI